MKRPGPAIVVILLIIMAFVLLGIAQYMIGTPPGSGSGNVSYTLDNTLPEPRYYTGIVFDTLKSNDHLTLIPLKSFRQQVTNYTCGPVAAMTVLSYYGMPANNTDADEIRIAQEMSTSANGTNPEQIASWFNRNGWNATWGTGGTGQMLRDNLEAGIPTMVEWIDWGGHWVVVVGYDTRGTETVWDDVIIFADSSDCHDDQVDGITYANYGEFSGMWFDAHYFPANMSNRAYVIAVPA